MARGKEKTFTSQAGRRRGPNRELPFASSLVSSMSLEKLISFYKIPNNINLELSGGLTVSTVEEADNTVYFTQENFAVELRFPLSSPVKQFLHVSQAPPVLIHLNAIWILMGCTTCHAMCQVKEIMGKIKQENKKKKMEIRKVKQKEGKCHFLAQKR